MDKKIFFSIACPMNETKAQEDLDTPPKMERLKLGPLLTAKEARLSL